MQRSACTMHNFGCIIVLQSYAATEGCLLVENCLMSYEESA